jgi:hypothetical protein
MQDAGTLTIIKHGMNFIVVCPKFMCRDALELKTHTGHLFKKKELNASVNGGGVIM